MDKLKAAWVVDAPKLDSVTKKLWNHLKETRHDLFIKDSQICNLRKVSDPTDPEIDIIFVHGVPSSQWSPKELARDAWPNEVIRKSLERDFPSARVFAFDHGDFSRECQRSIVNIAGLLMSKVVGERYEVPNRPIVWVVYSLGGVLLKKGLVDASVAGYEQLQAATKGICFLGTPHRSNSLAGWTRILAAYSQLFTETDTKGLNARTPSALERSRSDMSRLRFYGLGLDEISTISADFLEVVACSDILILTFLETQKTATSAGEVMVALEESARLSIPNERAFHLSGNHRDLANFGTDQDGYKVFREFTQGVLRRIHALRDDQYESAVLPQLQSLRSDDAVDEKVVTNPEEREQKFLTALHDDWLDESSIQSRHSGTCSWLLSTPEWQGWLSEKDNTGDLLFLHGQPGCGKTILAKFVARELRNAVNEGASSGDYFQEVTVASETAQTSARPVLVYFFDFAIPARRESLVFARSILYQLLSLNSSLFEYVQGSSIFTGQKMNFEDLRKVLLAAAADRSLTKGCDIVIDAVDECRTADQQQLFEFMTSFSKIPKCRVFVTSRTEVANDRPFSMLKASHRIDLADKHDEISKDICLLVDFKIELLATKRRWPVETQLKIVKKLRESISQRSFLLTDLLIEQLKRGKTVRRINDLLNRDSYDLDGLLEYSLSNFDESELKKDVLAILYYIMAAKEPLGYGELSALLALTRCRQTHHESSNDDVPHLSLIDIMQDYMVDLPGSIQYTLPLLRSCEGKVMLANKQVEQFFGCDQNVDRLLCAWDRQDMISKIDRSLNMQDVHCMLAEACLTYILAVLSSERDPLDFLAYPWRHWCEHVRDAGSGFSDLGAKLVSNLLKGSLGQTSPDHAKLERVLSAAGLSYNVRVWPTSEDPFHIYAAFDICEALSRSLDASEGPKFTKDDLARTPLHIAAANNSVNTIKYFVQQGRMITSNSLDEVLMAKDQNGLSAIHLAVQSDFVESTALLLDGLESTVSFDVPLIDAKNGVKSVEMLKCLWERRHRFRSQGGQAQLALDAAIRFGEENIIAELLTPQNLTQMSRVNALSVMYTATSVGSFEIVKKLLDQHLPVNYRYDSGVTPLHLAIGSRSEQVVDFLLKLGADVDAMDDTGRTPLHIAGLTGAREMVKLLLDHGSDPLFQDNAKEEPLHLAVKGGHIETCKVLCDSGADVLSADGAGKTSLHFAAVEGYPELTEFLLDQGADPNALDSKGTSPLHSAADAGHAAVVSALCAHGARIDALDKNGCAPLNLAVLGGNLDAAESLIEHGASLEIPDSQGQTLVQSSYHSKKNAGPMVKLLLQHGAKARRRDLEPHHLVASSERREIEKKANMLRAESESRIGRILMHQAQELVDSRSLRLASPNDEERQIRFVTIPPKDSQPRRQVKFVTHSRSDSSSQRERPSPAAIEVVSDRSRRVRPSSDVSDPREPIIIRDDGRRARPSSDSGRTPKTRERASAAPILVSDYSRRHSAYRDGSRSRSREPRERTSPTRNDYYEYTDLRYHPSVPPPPRPQDYYYKARSSRDSNERDYRDDLEDVSVRRRRLSILNEHRHSA